jgi:hypothetical protein
VARDPLYAWLETRSVERRKMGKRVEDAIVLENMFDFHSVNN